MAKSVTVSDALYSGNCIQHQAKSSEVRVDFSDCWGAFLMLPFFMIIHRLPSPFAIDR